MGVKVFYYLVATMNLVFPDYDFGDVDMSAFVPQPSLQNVMAHVNTTIFNTGVSRNIPMGDFTARLWGRIDGAIGLADCEIYSFVGQDAAEEVEDPFRERGCVYVGVAWA